MARVTSDSVAADQLRAFIERVERLEEEKASIGQDIKEVYAEAKGNGFDTKVLRKIVAIRKMDAAERAEQEALLELYLSALGMTPLEEAAARDDDDADPPDGTVSGIAEAMRDLDAIEARTDASLKRLASTPRLRRAARDFVKTAEKLGGVTIEAGGTVVEIGKRKPKKPHDAVGFDVGAGA